MSVNSLPSRDERPLLQKWDMTPRKLEKETRTKRRKADDEEENVKVRARSQGQCEIESFGRRTKRIKRCQKRAQHIHHMIGGWGKRARGKSLLAEHKQHACPDCHSDITGHVLKRVGDVVPLWTDCYERAE